MTKGSHGFYQGNIICDCPEMWVVHHGEKCASCDSGNDYVKINGKVKKTKYKLYYKDVVEPRSDTHISLNKAI